MTSGNCQRSYFPRLRRARAVWAAMRRETRTSRCRSQGLGTSCSCTSSGQCLLRAGTAARKCRKSQVRIRPPRFAAIAITIASTKSSPLCTYLSTRSRARPCSPSVGLSSECVPASNARPNTTAASARRRAHRTRCTSTYTGQGTRTRRPSDERSPAANSCRRPSARLQAEINGPLSQTISRRGERVPLLRGGTDRGRPQ